MYLAAGQFDREPTFFQFGFQNRALVALNLDALTLDTAANAAALLEIPGQFFQLCFSQGQAIQDSHSFASAALGLPADTNNAITRGPRSVIATDTL